MNSKNITLIDAGTGNLRSVFKALEYIGAQVTLTDEAAIIRQANKVILPGVGAFGDFMAGLRQTGLDQAVLEVVQRGVPTLGICVGMQALFETGEEMGTHAGLGLLCGRVIRFSDSKELKIPHTGWNQVWRKKETPLLEGLEDGAYAYFNHSYYCEAGDPADVSAVTDYGILFTSMVQRENLYGVQFHPEKSQQVGIQILTNFAVSGGV